MRSSRPPTADLPRNTIPTDRPGRRRSTGWWRSTRPGRRSATRSGGRASIRLAVRQRPNPPTGRHRSPRRRGLAERGPPRRRRALHRDLPALVLRRRFRPRPRRAATARVGVAGLDAGPLDHRRRLRREDDARAGGLRGRRPAAGQSVGQRPELRPLRRLVARRGRAGRSRVHRVAGSDADRAAVSRRDRRDPAPRRPPDFSVGRCHEATRPVQAALTGRLAGHGLGEIASLNGRGVTTPRGFA